MNLVSFANEFIIIKFVNMNKITERVVSQTINKYGTISGTIHYYAIDFH